MRRKLVCSALAILMVVLVSTTRAEAQLLDGTWLKLTAQASGPSLIWDGVSNYTFSKNVAFSTVCYMKVIWNGGQYEGKIACRWTDGVWSQTSSLFFTENLDGTQWSYRGWAWYWNTKGNYVRGEGQHFLVPLIKNGVLKQLKLIGGGNTEWAYVSGNVNGPFGPYRVNGVSVKEAKVPPEVVAVFP